MGVKVDENAIVSDPTIISGNFSITADGGADYHFSLEGIKNEDKVELRGVGYAQFIKCNFAKVSFEANHGSFENWTFLHCYVSKFGGMYNCTFTAISSYFKEASFSGNNSVFSLTNCVIGYPYSYFDSAYLKNCIIISAQSSTLGNQETNIYNTLWAGERSTDNPFQSVGEDHNNYILPEGIEVFEEGTFCKLTEAAKVYLGSDGTELGIYGGNLPFDPTPSTPQITKFNVASKTTADGKLSVDITVKQPD